MKLSLQPEAASGEFEGRTAEEAVRLARAALGEDAAVRCWKTRRGGVGGFFTRETFVAATAPPAGAVRRVKVARAAPPRRAAEREQAHTATKEMPEVTAPRAEDVPESANLAELVEWTEDEVVLGPDAVADDAFLRVLAEAEAAVHAAPVLTPSRPSAPAPPAAPDEGPAEAPTADEHPVEAPHAAVAPEGPARIDDLRGRLADIGVPRQFLPDEDRSTLDGLAGALARLPTADPVPSAGGSVIVVVGARREAHATARSVSSQLGLDAADLLEADPNDVSRHKVARRRASNKVTVVVLEASPRSRSLPLVAGWIEKVKPDQVLGAVPASTKCADVAHWHAQIGRVDALALSRLSGTMTPGELMGELPIAYLEGRPASILRWALLLLTTIEERTR